MLSGKKVLVVEDNSMNMIILMEFLTNICQENNGELDIVQVEDTERAIHAIIKRKPDILFLDLVMPFGKMHGKSLIDVIRKTDRYKNMYIIVVTADKFHGDEVMTGPYQADALLYKPIFYEHVQAELFKGLEISQQRNNEIY